MSTDLKWLKSSYSSEQGECVEVAPTPHTIHIRDSKDTTRPSLTLSPTTWSAFVATYRNGH
ncbi:DUF397 domain-containing protein [Streptomyces sp. ISL-96]|uniref:DUF397 domain-containing protein n=1 Tax=Streptomyces sp. ISL-96 TaxID=2819191 RepID=UPI001BE8CB2F|nr:DUF397 domain-containing protein [Streptomyces sp. ISL-96]MBT2489154.1 DUF397 domain-containing protein [Streptomyces sp. ISL-96]